MHDDDDPILPEPSASPAADSTSAGAPDLAERCQASSRAFDEEARRVGARAAASWAEIEAASARVGERLAAR